MHLNELNCKDVAARRLQQPPRYWYSRTIVETAAGDNGCPTICICALGGVAADPAIVSESELVEEMAWRFLISVVPFLQSVPAAGRVAIGNACF